MRGHPATGATGWLGGTVRGADSDASAGQDRVRRWSLERSGRWYDITVEVRGLPGFRRRFAGRVETGRHSLSDPAMGGPARGAPG